MDIKQIMQRLEKSFHPYRCVVKIDDYQNLIFLKIFDEKKKLIVQTPSVNADSIDESKLQTLIERTKETINSEGYSID